MTKIVSYQLNMKKFTISLTWHEMPTRKADYFDRSTNIQYYFAEGCSISLPKSEITRYSLLGKDGFVPESFFLLQESINGLLMYCGFSESDLDGDLIMSNIMYTFEEKKVQKAYTKWKDKEFEKIVLLSSVTETKGESKDVEKKI